MNRFLEQHGEIFRETQDLRSQLLDLLTDSDLNFSLGGSTLTLGALCQEMGEVEYAYIQSLRTLKMDWSYRHPDPGRVSSVAGLRVWYDTLDAELRTIMEALTDADLHKTIDRGFPISVAGQLHVYSEAMLIFYGKASIYLRAMGKTTTRQWQDWIG